MRSGLDSKPLRRALDGFASRGGLGISVAALIGIGVWASLSVEKSVRQLQANLSVFQESQRRNGFVAISDVVRLQNIVSRGWTTGQFTEETKDDFGKAVDILYVRTDHFRRVIDDNMSLTAGHDAVAALETIISIADQAVADDFPDPKALYLDLQRHQEEARSRLVTFLDDMDRLQDQVLEDQSQAIAHQRVVVDSSLAALAILALAAVFLLRREILARQAREKAESEVEFLAYFDPLTRLANRAQFQKRIEKLLADRQPVTLLLMDLDNFKIINDAQGHGAGDAVLEAIGSEVQKIADGYPDGFAARLGGDEFAMVLPNAAPDQMHGLCERLIGLGENLIEYEGETLKCGMSIGLASSNQLKLEMVGKAESLSRVADFALYAAKSAGRGRYEQYNEGLERQFLERRALVDALPQALKSGELDVYFQPKVTLPTGSVYGFEALVRWQRDGRFVPPELFVSIAEESGQVLELDRFVLRSAAQILARLNRDYGLSLSVSTNLSGLHFNSLGIVNYISNVLETTDIAPHQLTLEITETVELKDWDRAQSVITAIRDTGAKISIDDFGTGYSSIGYLYSISADELKVDRSLIQDIETSDTSRFLVDAVVDMAQNLGLDVIVEGVEKESQAQAIFELGCKRAQGFLYGKPMSEQDVRAYLDVRDGSRSNGSRATV